MGEAIHFRGKDAIVKAYETNDVPAFALVQGKELLFQYTGTSIEEGAQLLDGFVEMLAEGHSQGIYQVRMYRKPPEDLTLKDKYNFSFKCRLVDDDGAAEYLNENSVLARRVKALEEERARVSGFEEEDDEQGAPGWQATLGAILNKPEVQNYLLPKIFGFVDKLLGGTPRAATVGSVPGTSAGPNPNPPAQEDPTEVIDTNALYMNLAPEQRAALDQAMGIFLQNDPEIGTNLLKCAMVLKNNPTRYRMGLSML